MKLFKKAVAIVSVLFVAALALPALAVAPDYTTMTSAVVFDGVITAFLAIGAVLMGMYVVWKGVKLTINMLKSG